MAYHFKTSPTTLHKGFFDDLNEAIDNDQNFNFRILRLPAELRNRIYFEVLAFENPRYISDLIKPPKYRYDRPPALLQTCHQLREETRAIYYSNNRFFIVTTENREEHIIKWLRTLEAGDVKALRHIQISDAVCSPSVAEQLFDHIYDRVKQSKLELADDALKLHVRIRNKELDMKCKRRACNLIGCCGLSCVGWVQLQKMFEDAELS